MSQLRDALWSPVACSLLLCLEWHESWLLLQLLWLLLIQTKILSALEHWCLVLFKPSWDFCSSCFVWPYFPNRHPFQRLNDTGLNFFDTYHLTHGSQLRFCEPMARQLNFWSTQNTHATTLEYSSVVSLFGTFVVHIEEASMLCFIFSLSPGRWSCVFFSLK